jgi:hypothetical protein
MGMKNYIHGTTMAGNYFWIYFFSCRINCAPFKKVAVAEFSMLSCVTRIGGKAIIAIFCNSYFLTQRTIYLTREKRKKKIIPKQSSSICILSFFLGEHLF